MKAVIFGANGQDGFYLSQLLERKNVQAVGISRSVSENDDKNLHGDVADWQFVENIVRDIQPDFIFHFAANSTTNHSALFDNHQAISTGTINILEAVYRHSHNTKVFLSGSAVQFENTGKPIDENMPFAPISPYAVSRIHSIYAGRYYRQTLNLKVYAGYFFNHDSPLRTERHVNQKIAAAARRIAAGSDEKIEIGNIKVKKEFNFAGDTVEAVWTLVNQDEVYEAVIGCGEAHSIEEWIELCFSKTGKNWHDYIVVNENYKPEYEILVSNPTLLKSLGWQPKTSFAELAKMMISEDGDR